MHRLADTIRRWGAELGLTLGFSAPQTPAAVVALDQWLAQGRHGEMAWMARHRDQRADPAQLLPQVRSVICARLDYLPEPQDAAVARLADPHTAYLSRYALGRDYHKVVRQRLKQLALRIEQEIGPFGWRPFSDSAPVLEKPLAAQAGLGWQGKHTNLLCRERGSWFFLGELYTDLPLPADAPVSDHCGDCTACIDHCPTGAITAPGQLDARRCIAYLTIELHGPIPEPLRPLIGNRIYGCDDCQLCCPWNRFATLTRERDFLPRHGLDHATLVDLFAWDEATFLARTEGSPLRRLGWERWLRNLAIALGNAPPTTASRAALAQRRDAPSPLVREHVAWAEARLGSTES